jgi:hypothetical protein
MINKKVTTCINLLSACNRVYPDFLIIGAQKSGTTTLFYYLIQHPQVLPPLKKEIHYFDKKYHLGSLWYRAHFPLRKKMGADQITGEKSTDYIFHPLGAPRIKNAPVKPKLILLLRDPVKRAISHYNHQVRMGREKRNPEKAFQEEDLLFQNNYASLFRKGYFNREKITHYLRFSYKQKGLYLEQIKRYHMQFSADDLIIEAAENLFQEPASVAKRVYDFLGIDPGFTPDDLSSQNVGGYKSNAATAKIAQQLKEFYKPHNEALFTYLGRRFPWQ